MKRSAEVILSAAAIIILSPLLVIISLAILISSGWPIFYVQERVGKDKKVFRLIKFRTMVRNADALKAYMWNENEAVYPFFKINKDTRITKIGRILRKLSLDELPQLFNVLMGDMAFVGPRPVLREEAAHLNELRFTVRPGITGPTQIYRNKQMGLNERNKLEIEYIQNKNDLSLILKTFKVVFKGE